MERLTIRRKNGVIQSDLKQKGNAMSRLATIEDILGDNYELDRLRELVQADREGRVNVLPYPKASTCGKCENFARKPGCTYGKCLLNPNRTVYQSRVKCKRYTENVL